MKHKLWAIVLMLCMGNLLQAQHHEISLNLGGGLSMLQYTPNIANVILTDIPPSPYVPQLVPSSGGQKPDLGGSVGLGYHYFFTPNWGIGSGVNVAFYNAQTKINNYTVDSDERAIYGTPGVPSDFIFRYAYEKYTEKQRVSMVTIPLMVQYQTKSYTTFYAALGGKVGIPIAAAYKVSDDFSTLGYFPNTQTPYDSLPSQGFGRYSRNTKEDLDLKIAFMLSAELGVKFYFEHFILYTGVYCDYGLTDIRGDIPTAPLVGYQPETPDEFTYGNMIGTSDKLYPMAAGITVRLSVGIPTRRLRGALSRGMIVAAPPTAPATTLFRRR